MGLRTPKKIDKNGSRIHYGWICATGGLSSRFVYATATSTLPLVLVEVKIGLGISNADAGSISATFGVLFIVSALLWGVIADKIGLRKSLTIACLILSIGTLGMGTINSTLTGMIFYSLIGFAAGAPIALSAMITGAWFDKRRRGIAQSYINSTDALWMAMLGVTVPIIMLALGWRDVWYILAVISLCLSVIVYALIRNRSQRKGSFSMRSTIKKNIEYRSKSTNNFRKTRQF